MSLVKTQIESWCNKNSVSILEGELFNIKNSNIFICNENSFENFLELALKNSIQHIVIDEEVFDIKEETSQEVELKLDTNINIDSIIEDVFSEFKKHDTDLKSINIYWSKDGVSYLYLYVEEWYEDFLHELEVYINNSKKLLELSSLEELPEAIYKNLIDELASSDLYYINNTRPQNFEMVLSDIMDKLKINRASYFINSFAIELEVKKLFSRKYKRKKELEYIEKIKEMRTNKMTKNSIISKLGITEGMYDRLSNV